MADRFDMLTTIHHRRYRQLWSAAALFTVYGAALPFHVATDRAVVQQHMAEALARSRLADVMSVSIPDLTQNVLLFVPFGLFAAGSLHVRRLVPRIATVVALAATLSVACEGLQLFTVDRVSSLWDVWANSAGALLGSVAWFSLHRFARLLRRHIELAGLTHVEMFPLVCAVALVCISAWEPFDVTLDLGTVWSKVKPFTAGTWTLWRPLTDELLSCLRYGLLAFLAREWIQRRGYTPYESALVTAAGGAALVVCLEGSQFLITSRFPSVQDALAGVVGVSMGAAIISEPRRGALAVLTGASVCAAIPVYLQPFVFVSRPAPVALLPFLAYYEFTSLQVVSHVLDLMLIYAPVGFAYEWSRPAHGMQRASLLTLTLAGTCEYAQGWVAGRYPDVTDVGVAVLGAAGGALLARWRVELMAGAPAP